MYRVALFVGLVCGVLVNISHGQEDRLAVPAYRYPARIYWSHYDPYSAVTSRIYAQAELIRAQGVAAVSYAEARNLHAEAYSKELDNWKKELRIYWERKTLAKQKQLELENVRQIARMEYLNDQKWKNSRLWDRLKNHPELSGPNIRNGGALNFLMSRLAVTSLPYEFDPQSSRFAPAALEQLQLDSTLLKNVQLRQGPLTFNASERMDGTITLWPYILRWPEFEDSRSAFERARVNVVQEAENLGMAPVEAIEQLEVSLMKLSKQFHASEKVTEWVKQENRYTHFCTADRFLQNLDREILELQKSGDIRPLSGERRYDPRTDGSNLLSLLCFMNRNGVEFAPAAPGGEFAYHGLFVQMRGLYLTLAEGDESIEPIDIGELAK